jgi:hypothetical protein
MNENEIGTGLARLEALRRDDDRRLAHKIVSRDRRRIWLLSGLAVLFWAISAAGVFFVVYTAIFHLYPKQQKLMQAQAAGTLPTQQLIEIQSSHFRAVELCTLVVAASFIAATLAAICTLSLILVSRQATLTHINSSLAKIFQLLEQPTPAGKDELPPRHS